MGSQVGEMPHGYPALGEPFDASGDAAAAQAAAEAAAAAGLDDLSGVTDVEAARGNLGFVAADNIPLVTGGPATTDTDVEARATLDLVIAALEDNGITLGT